ncbi:MAG: hypothetical protein K9J16_13075 [Melioribacteraceae bacterium]|nr:hypothetical protein [Melioribacteraceae bacterium]MCF8355368.1 hypothetical protein [Melioribacteraceae bacterium]MCF8396007.1 hypothetical protein [Melioribacteraceae bacterium]MCF8420251.1 hypothetical protein [Melioribacteraceae bacterium]
MTTLAPPPTRVFLAETIEKKIYNIVDRYKEYIPVMNDRNRLAFSLYKYITGEGDSPDVLVKTTKVKIEGITKEELAAKLEEELQVI